MNEIADSSSDPPSRQSKPLTCRQQDGVSMQCSFVRIVMAGILNWNERDELKKRQRTQKIGDYTPGSCPSCDRLTPHLWLAQR